MRPLNPVKGHGPCSAFILADTAAICVLVWLAYLLHARVV